MLFSSRVLQQWCFALFLLCSPVPHFGRPIDALSSRIKRSVTHAQLMHDKGRTLQEIRRRLWLQDLLDDVHTAEIRDLPVPVRTTGGGGGSSSGAGVGLPGFGLSINPSTTGSTLRSKPPGGTKNLPLSFQQEVEEERTNLPQETNKSQTYKDGVLRTPGKKKKKVRSGKKKEGEKRKRRVRSLRWRLEDEPGSGLHLEWRSLLDLQRVLQ
ncbi:parathyroid hormone-like hormone a [Pholidichthys leucotaenia]